MSKDKQDTVVGGVQYRENVVLGIVDTPEAAQAAGQALTSGGFLESEVALGCGLEWADRVRASSGRSGLIGQVLQVLVATKHLLVGRATGSLSAAQEPV